MNVLQRQSSHKYGNVTPDRGEKLDVSADITHTAMSVRAIDDETESKSASISEAVLKEPTDGRSHIATMIGSAPDNKPMLTIAGAISKGEIKSREIVANGQTGIDLMVADKVDIKDFNLELKSDLEQELLVQEFIEWEKMVAEDPPADAPELVP